jgi:hypothetical protein
MLLGDQTFFLSKKGYFLDRIPNQQLRFSRLTNEKSRRGRTPTGIQPRRLTRQRTPRASELLFI